jgi:hypothetical protein
MAVKAVNNTISLDGLILILLVYGAYSRINNLDPFTLSVINRAAVIQNAITEIIKL